MLLSLVIKSKPKFWLFKINYLPLYSNNKLNLYNMIVNKLQFPKFTGIKCNMMPFIQGDSSSLPDTYKPYAKIIDQHFLEKGEIGYLTIDESFVNAGQSQRGYNNTGIDRNVHIEVGHHGDIKCWGGGGGSSWGGHGKTILEDTTMVLIANSISDTCRVWDAKEMRYTKDGDLSQYIDMYPEETGLMLKSGEVAKISIFTPHECINQTTPGKRQFMRIVGKGVTGREEYFTINPLMEEMCY
jgi:hypothetical protein